MVLLTCILHLVCFLLHLYLTILYVTVIFAIVPYKNSKTSLLLSVHHNALKSYTDRRNVHNLCNVVRGDGEQLWGRVNN